MYPKYHYLNTSNWILNAQSNSSDNTIVVGCFQVTHNKIIIVAFLSFFFIRERKNNFSVVFKYDITPVELINFHCNPLPREENRIKKKGKDRCPLHVTETFLHKWKLPSSPCFPPLTMLGMFTDNAW